MTDQRDTLTDLITQNVLWESYVKAGEKAWMRKEHVEALRNFTVAKEKSRHFDPGDWRHVKSVQSLSRIYYELKNFTEAERVQSELLTLIESSLGPDSAEMISELKLLAIIYEHNKKYDQAEATYAYIIKQHPRTEYGQEDPSVHQLHSKCREMKKLQYDEQRRTRQDIEWIG